MLNIIDYTNKLINNIVKESKSTQESLLSGRFESYEEAKRLCGIIYGMESAISVLRDTCTKLINDEENQKTINEINGNGVENQ